MWPKLNPMKHLLTLTALLISSLAMGQFPNLPYNPDENGDGLIGVVDLQGLLANYGNEFASAVVSEDGESSKRTTNSPSPCHISAMVRNEAPCLSPKLSNES